MRKLKLYITLLLFGFLSITYSLYSQSTIEKVSIADSNEVMFYFNELPITYKSKLSDDKRKLIISIANSNVQDNAKNLSGKGKIESVYINKVTNGIECIIILKERAGYTAVALPYSKAISVEIFKWEELSPAQDNYRSALLAIEDNIEVAAEKLLTSAHRSGLPDASAHLGIFKLRKGNLSEAAELLKSAAINRTGIHDVFGGISQLLNLNNQAEKAQLFAERFKKRTGLDFLPEIALNAIDDTIAGFSLGINYFDEVLAIRDTVNTLSDTISKQFPNLFARDSLSVDNKNENKSEFLPDWLFLSVLALIILAIVFAFIFGLRYLKWRQMQLEILKNKTRKSFSKEFDDAIKSRSQPNSEKGAELYNQSGRIVDKTISDDEKGNSETIIPIADDSIRTETASDTEEKLFAILSKVNEIKKEKEINDEIPEQSPKKGYSPKLELAMHLQQEQQKLKQKNISGLQTKSIPTDVKRLNEFAKNLGIEKGSLEIKKALDDISKNKNSMEDLAKKFKLNK